MFTFELYARTQFAGPRGARFEALFFCFFAVLTFSIRCFKGTKRCGAGGGCPICSTIRDWRLTVFFLSGMRENSLYFDQARMRVCRTG